MPQSVAALITATKAASAIAGYSPVNPVVDL
jgi:hypothetical protein